MATRPLLRRRHAQNAAAFAGGFGGVLQQVGEDALDQILVGHHVWTRVGQAALVGHFGMRGLQEGDALLRAAN